VKLSLPFVLIIVGGVLIGGVVSLRQQGFPKVAQAIVAVLAALSLVAGVFWMV
jgi:hypothetical protein